MEKDRHRLVCLSFYVLCQRMKIQKLQVRMTNTQNRYESRQEKRNGRKEEDIIQERRKGRRYKGRKNERNRGR